MKALVELIVGLKGGRGGDADIGIPTGDPCACVGVSCMKFEGGDGVRVNARVKVGRGGVCHVGTRVGRNVCEAAVPIVPVKFVGSIVGYIQVYVAVSVSITEGHP